jgi:alkylated DNA repair dioxygenase AlkB
MALLFCRLLQPGRDGGIGRSVGENLFEPQPTPLASAVAAPAGFDYRPDAISQHEERDLVDRFEALPFEPFEFHGYRGKRRIVSYGWRYDYAGRRLRGSDPIPGFLLPLRGRAASLAALPADGLTQVLVTEYAPGAGIGWHRDKAIFEDVLAVSFVSPCRLRLRRKEGAAWRRWSLEIAPRSLYLLRGPSRREWQHSVPPVAALRYSVTFRSFTAGQRT